MDDPLMEPVKSVLDHYLAIQKELAKDSIKGVDEPANAIAKDLKAAREADKPLSASPIRYLAESKAGKGVYHEAYCPMAKASWLQADKTIKNPCVGKAMLGCGELKN
jgi:hypothetical protein